MASLMAFVARLSPAIKDKKAFKQKSKCKFDLELYIWVIDQSWDQDSRILLKVLFCEFMDGDGVEVHKLPNKNKSNKPRSA